MCSESIGSSSAPARRAASITAAPAQTSVSLLASATVRPARDRGESRLEAGRADDRGDDQIGLAQRGLLDRRGARGGLDAEPRKRRLEVGVAGGIGDGGEFGAELDRASGERRAVASAGDRGDRESARRAAITRAQERPIEPVAPRMTSRLGRAAPSGPAPARANDRARTSQIAASPLKQPAGDE